MLFNMHLSFMKLLVDFSVRVVGFKQNVCVWRCTVLQPGYRVSLPAMFFGGAFDVYIGLALCPLLCCAVHIVSAPESEIA